jgi:hypothetical protein
MRDYNLAAIHDRIDEEHFEMRLHSSAITAIQRTLGELEAAVHELRREVFERDVHAGEQRRVRRGANGKAT